MTAPRRTPPRKLNIGDLVTPPSMSNHHHHQSQGIAALFAITFDLRVHSENVPGDILTDVQAGYTITWQQPAGNTNFSVRC